MKRITFGKCILVLLLSALGLSAAAQTELWGVSTKNVFKYDFDLDTVLAMASIPTSYASSLAKGKDGKFYGVTSGGGLNGKGYLYRFDPSTNTVSPLHSLSLVTGYGANGTSVLLVDDSLLFFAPFLGTGRLIKYNLNSDSLTVLAKGSVQSRYHQPFLANNGSVFGTFMIGGANGLGYIYEYKPGTDTATNVYSFNSTDGKSPNSGFVQAGNGKLYGTTTEGGAGNRGVFYSYDIMTKAYSVIHNCASSNSGPILPYGSFIEVNPGVLCTMAQGGTYNNGCIIYFDINTNTITRRVNLKDSDHGYSPRATVMKGQNGNIYTTTASGGPNNRGCLLEYNYALNQLKTLYEFKAGGFGQPSIGGIGPLRMIEACRLPQPFASILPDTSFLCEIDFKDTLKASSCYGIINGKANVTFPLKTLGKNWVEWTYNDGHGNYTKQSHYITIDSLDRTVKVENGKIWANQSGASYQWKDCSGADIQGANGQSFLPPDSGSYQVVIGFKSCEELSECSSIKKVKVEKVDSIAIRAYPNPTGNWLHITSKVHIDQIEIFDLVGQRIEVLDGLGLLKRSINLTDFNTRSYIVVVKTSRGIRRKVIIKK